MNEPTHELEAYYAGTADEHQLRTIEAWLHADPANAREFMDQLHFRELLAERLHERSNSTANVLAELADLESKSQADIVTVGLDLSSKSSMDRGPLSKHDLVAAGSYLLHHTLTPKVIATLATAAAVLLGVVLAIVLLGGPDEQQQIVEGPERSNTPTPTIVANLTAEHEAVWDRRPGGDLYAGQRFTLTQGFAEITTQRGAIIILEAPATIEMMDSSNAIHLHAGKLVGICEIDYSKGLLVRTPQLDIRDLGTRFGVDTNSITTEVHVLQGEIEAATVLSGSGEEDSVARLVEGEALSCEAGDIQRITLDANRFATSAHTHILPGTGLDLSNTEIDRAWQITAIDGELLNEPIGLNVFIDAERKKLAINEPELAQWINYSPPNWEEGENDNRVYTLQTTIVIPSNIDLDDSSLVMDYVADDYVAGLVINGRPADISNLTSQKKRKGRIILSASEHGLVSGVNTVEFQIFNRIKHIGLHMSWRVQGDAGRLSTIYP